MPKTATAKNLNKAFPKKPVSQSEKDTKSLSAKLAKFPICPVLPVPDAAYLVKKSTKEQLAAQVVELTKGLNGANKSIETLGNQSVLALHDLGIAKRTIKAMKKGTK